MLISVPGIYRMDAETYHSDPCVEPSLSNSIGKLLIERSPMHARYAHPRLNPSAAGGRSSAAMDDGSILHKLILGNGVEIVSIDADSYRSKGAQEARDAARGAGKTPCLAGRLRELEVAAEAIRGQIEKHPDCDAFGRNGRSEAAMIWRDDAIWCRSLVDFLPDGTGAPIYDLKTTALSASPESFERRLVSEYAFQAAFYMRGARALGRRPSTFLFIVAEVNPPFGVSVMSPAPLLMALAEDDVGRAISLWEQCLRDKAWPGYPQFTAYVEAPAWMLTRQSDRMLREEFEKETAQ